MDDHGLIFPNNEKVIYISRIATLEEARGKGVGTQLLKYIIEYLKSNELYDYIYWRTNLEGSIVSRIAKKMASIHWKKIIKYILKLVSLKELIKTYQILI